MKKNPFPLVLLFVLLSTLAAADQRTEPIDVIVALDKSLSMEEEIGAVIDYVNNYLIDQLLIPGDFFLVVAFYGKTETPVAMKITGEADKAMAKKAIAKLIADGRFTDIGNALDSLGTEVQKLSDPSRKKYLLLVTDGIQEAPPQSKYYSPDGKFSHELLENTKVIQKQGWKIHILGIGTHEEAQQLAAELSAKYSELSTSPTKEEFIETTKDFLGTIEVTSGADMSAVDYRGNATLKLTVRSRGYDEDKTLSISDVRLTLDDGTEQSILREPASLSVPPEQSREAAFPIRLPSRPAGGEHEGSLQFFFAGEEHFTPVVMPVSFHVQSLVESYWYWILVAAAVVALIVVAAVLLATRLRKLKVRFRLAIEGRRRAAEDRVYTIVEGTPQFLDETEGTFTIAREKSPQSLARLTAIANGVRMTVLRADKFYKLRELPQNVLDFEFRVRTETKKELAVRLTGLK